MPSFQTLQTSLHGVPCSSEGVCTNFVSQGHRPRPRATCAVDRPLLGAPLPLMRVLFCSPFPCASKPIFIIFFCLCLSLWFAGAPLHCSSASSTPIEQSPSPPPSPPANESQRRLLGNGVAQPTPDSDSEEEFVPNSFLVKSGSASLGVAANGKSLFLPNFCGVFFPPFRW